MKRLVVCVVIVAILTSCRRYESKTGRERDVNMTQVDGEKTIKNDGKSNDNSYVFETDDQPFYFMSNMTGASNGYYIMIGSYLYLYDKAAQEITLLCGKPDCDHKNSECNAFFRFFEQQICHYNGALYMIGSDWGDEENWCLYKVSLDGGTREKLAVLYKVDELGQKGYVPSLIVHRGYAYYTVTIMGQTQSKRSQSIYRINLSDGDYESEEIYSMEGYDMFIYLKGAYGNKLLFHNTDLEDGDIEKLRNYLFAYDIESRGVTECKLNENHERFRLIGMDGDTILYGDEDGVSSYHLLSGERKVISTEFYADDVKLASYDNVNLYFYEAGDYTKPITVMNKEGEVVDQIGVELTGSSSADPIHAYVLFGDESNLLAMDMKTQEFLVYDKSQLGKSEGEWKRTPYEIVEGDVSPE